MTRFQLKFGGAAAAAFVWILTNPALAQMPTLGRECSQLKTLRYRESTLKMRLNSIRIGNKRAWCPVVKQQIATFDEMIRIFYSDSERCGLRDDIINGLQSNTERLRQAIFRSCGD